MSTVGKHVTATEISPASAQPLYGEYWQVYKMTEEEEQHECEQGPTKMYSMTCCNDSTCPLMYMSSTGSNQLKQVSHWLHGKREICGVMNLLWTS